MFNYISWNTTTICLNTMYPLFKWCYKMIWIIFLTILKLYPEKIIFLRDLMTECSEFFFMPEYSMIIFKFTITSCCLIFLSPSSIILNRDLNVKLLRYFYQNIFLHRFMSQMKLFEFSEYCQFPETKTKQQKEKKNVVRSLPITAVRKRKNTSGILHNKY